MFLYLSFFIHIKTEQFPSNNDDEQQQQGKPQESMEPPSPSNVSLMLRIVT